MLGLGSTNTRTAGGLDFTGGSKIVQRHFRLLRSALFLLPIFMSGPLYLTGVSFAERDVDQRSASLAASLDRYSAEVGTLVTLTLSYRLPPGSRLPAELEIKGLENLTIIDRFKEPNRIRLKFLIDRLEPWTLGPLSLTYLDKEGRTQTLQAEPISLTVLTNLAQSPAADQLRPIQGITPTGVRWPLYLRWAAGLLGILLAVGFIRWYRRKQVKEGPWEPTEPPHIRALREIEQLEARKLFEKALIKEFYFSFSKIMISYLASTRNFPAAGLTTEEITHYLNNHKDHKLLILLQQVDLIKFADRIPSQAEKAAHVGIALAYFQEKADTAENGLLDSSNAVITIAGTGEGLTVVKP